MAGARGPRPVASRQAAGRKPLCVFRMSRLSAVKLIASEDREDPVRETSPVKRPDRGIRSLNPVRDVRRHRERQLQMFDRVEARGLDQRCEPGRRDVRPARRGE